MEAKMIKPTQFLRTACASVLPLTQNACIGLFSLDSGTSNYLKKLDPDYWNVVSYNPTRGEICIIIYSKNSFGEIIGNRHLSLSVSTIFA